MSTISQAPHAQPNANKRDRIWRRENPKFPELVAKAQAGDKAAFVALANRHWALLSVIALRHSRLDRAAAAVLLDQMLETGWATISSFDGVTPYSWFQRILQDTIRARRALKSVPR